MLYVSYEKKTYRNYILKALKTKSIPFQAWTGPEGSKRMRFPNLKTIST